MERENLRKETEKNITEELLKERLNVVNKYQLKYLYQLRVEKEGILKYTIIVRNKVGDIVAIKSFYDKIETLAFIRGMEEIIKYL